MISELWKTFIERCQWEKNFTPKTLHSTPKTLRSYQQGWGAWGGLVELPITKASLSRVVVSLRKRKLFDVSVNTYLHVLRRFVHWLHKEGLPDLEPVREISVERPVPTLFKQPIGFVCFFGLEDALNVNVAYFLQSL
jgi:site-specific recombinase XerD